MPSIFCLQDDQDQGMHRTEYCLSVCLIPIPSMAYCLWWQDPLVHLRPCLDSASVRSRESLVAITAIPLAPISKMCGGICSLCHETTQLVQMWSEKSFLSFSKRFLVAICRAQQRAGCKSIWERFVWNPLQASTVEHSWITLAYDYYPSSNGLSKRHVALWQKMFVILPATFPLTVLTICAESSGRRCIFRQSWSRLSRELLEKFPIRAGLHTFWFVSLPDRWDRFNKTHSQQPGGQEHTITLTTLNRVCWGWACRRANHCVSLHAVLKSCLMSHSALVILSGWFWALLWGNRWNKSKALLGATAHSQLCRPSQGLKPQAYIPTNQHSWANIETSCEDAKEILEQTSCNWHRHAEYSISCWPF